MDIVISMNEGDFLHKTGRGMRAYWSMGRAPKKFLEGEKVFIVCRNHVLGYVLCDEFNPLALGEETIVWDAGTFRYIVSIPCKRFRGFRYRWFEYRLEKGQEAAHD